MKSVTIVIVNYNTGEQLTNCLRSINDADKTHIVEEVVVVDNSSTDRSLEGIQNINLKLRLIRNTKNLGFAKACNQGAKFSDSEYILFLNPDCQLRYDSLSVPIEFMEKEENKNIGIIGIQLINDKGEVTKSCIKFPTFWMFLTKIFGLHHLFPSGLLPIYYMYDFDFNSSKLVDQVSGAFFLVRRSLFEKLKGFDERFFVYFEDLDFSLRARRIGYSSYYLALVKAYHKGGGTTEYLKGVSLFYYLRSRILYCYKHFDIFQATILSFLTLFVEPITRIVFAILSKSSPYSIKDIIKAYFLIWSKIFNCSFNNQ